MHSKTIHGKIIRILDSKTIIINLGKQDGIGSENLFNILGKPETIVDPFTNEELGSINVVKGKLKALQVYDRFTIASTQWKQVTMRLSTSDLFENVFGTEDVSKGELNVDRTEISPWKAQSEELVKLGDIVTTEITVAENNKKAAPNKESGNTGT